MTRAAHHDIGGGFRNPWPGGEPRGFSGVVRWALMRRAGRKERLAGERLDRSLGTPDIASPRETSGALRVTYVGHSTVLLQIGGINVLTDPIWSERASPFSWAGPKRLVDPGFPLESLPPLDAVLLSHDHYDHLDEPTVRRLAVAHPEARWVAPLGVGARLLPWGVRQVVELDWWESTRVAQAEVTCTPAQHFSGRFVNDRDLTLWCGFAIRTDRWSVLYGGDTGHHPLFADIGRRCGPFDLVLMPIGAYEPRWFMRPVHMDAEEAVTAVAELAMGSGGQVPALLPVHWGTFRLTDEPMDEPPRRALGAWAARGFPADDLWLLRPGATRVKAASGSPGATG